MKQTNLFDRKTFCYRRLHYLKSKFELHCMLNEYKEITQQKTVPHRDFYNVRKVDTHIHASCSMTQSHLLDFIARKLASSPDLVVVKNYKGTGRPITLAGLFDALGLRHRDIQLDLDSLGIRAASFN